MLFLAAHGCPMEEFARLRVGPVVLRDEVEYYREVNLLEELTVSLECAAMAAEHGIDYRPLLTAPDLGFGFGT